MKRIVWSNQALRNLEKIDAYVSVFSPRAADRLCERIISAGESLSEHPERGRVKAGARELVCVAPYILRYRVEASRVVIIRIRHGARRPL